MIKPTREQACTLGVTAQSWPAPSLALPSLLSLGRRSMFAYYLTNSYKHKRVDIIIINKQLFAKLANEKPFPHRLVNKSEYYIHDAT